MIKICRLALLNKEGFNELENKFGVVKYFDYLEKANGGHGNGYVLIKDGKIVDYNKGVKLTNKKIVSAIKKHEPDWTIYHTRITSQGETCDVQCHPFVSPKMDYALCMNGTERNYGDIGKMLGTSDTDAIFRIWHSLNLPDEELKYMTSRFIGFRKKKGSKKGKVFFTNPSYNGVELMKSESNTSIVVGSCFPIQVDSDMVESKFYWEEGKKIKIKQMPKQIAYTKYVGNNIDYNRDFFSGLEEYICPECECIVEYHPFLHDKDVIRCCDTDMVTIHEYSDMLEEKHSL